MIKQSIQINMLWNKKATLAVRLDSNGVEQVIVDLISIKCNGIIKL